MRRRRSHARLTIAVLAVVIVAIATADHGNGPMLGGRNESDAADTVVRVVDGDTVVLRSAGKSRLIGVDTPEVFGTHGCFGEEASAFAKQTLRLGLRVKVTRDLEPRDRYGRSLLYLSLPDGRSFNDMLVEKGFAVPLTIEPNIRYAGRFRALASRARREHAGLWSPTTCDGRVKRSS